MSPLAPPAVRIASASTALRLADGIKWCALRSYPLFQAAATTTIPRWAEPLGARAALRAALHAYRRVPAYRKFVDASGWHDDRSLAGTERLRQLPIMDKSNYIQPYTTDERCLDGRLPLVGTEMDESSGSSGIPYNWVRGRSELNEVHRELSQFARYTWGGEIVSINCFSMGAWSTGINTAQALRRNGLVKSPGPDVEKILSTLQYLGPRHAYVITGYPPFLRHLLDQAEERGIDLRPYRMLGVVGGEGMSEQLRDKLETRFIAVYSAYGASDLDIGVAGETPVSVWLRRHAGQDRELQRALFGDDPRLPMVFQYNPLDYNVETINDELVITVSRLCMLSPRIRYNIHDSGLGHSFATVAEICRDFGLDPLSVIHPTGNPIFRLPFLCVRGRSDATISYMGANIYPEDVEQALYANPLDAVRIGAFCLELCDVSDGRVRPCVHVEISERASDESDLAERLQRKIVDRLMANSRDFRASVTEDPTAGQILVELHHPGHGPFAENNQRIKRRYIVAR